MSISETDLEQMETLLDGALDSAAVTALHARLKTEPELAACMEDLRAQRALRQTFFQSIEPNQTTADQLAWRIRGAMSESAEPSAMPMLKQSRQWDSWQVARFGSAAAACVVLGFFVGWVGRGNRPSVSISPGDSSVAVNRTESVGSPSSVPIRVPVSDEYGRVVTFQRFDNAEDAKAFTEGLNRARGAQTVPPPADDKVRLIDTPAEKF